MVLSLSTLHVACGGSPSDPGSTDLGEEFDAGTEVRSDVGPGDAETLDVLPSDAATDSGTPSTVEWPDQSQPPPLLDPDKPYDMADATRFLYEGDNPIQTGVGPGTIHSELVAIIRGKVLTSAGEPVAGVKVSVLGKPQYGASRTKGDGIFEFAINGGEMVTISLEHPAYLPMQRQVTAAWRDWTWMADVVMTPLDAKFTEVTLSTLTEAVVASGSAMEDADGARTARVVFEPGVTASMRLSNGAELPLDDMTVRATEYTVGSNGPSAMPAELPRSTMYTYAVELSVDEAMAVGASSVVFSRPVPLYVDNFLGVPVGTIVPVGLYDRECGCWVPSDNGRVLKVLEIDAERAVLDVDGDGEGAAPARLAELGISEAELKAIATQFAAGQTFWRSPIAHFTPIDCNFSGGPPPGCSSSGNPCVPPDPEPDPEPDPCEEGGSIISCEQQILRERIQLPGTGHSIWYTSQNAPGFEPNRHLTIPLTGQTLPPELKQVDLDVTIAGQLTRVRRAPEPNLRHVVEWDGRDAWGRRITGSVPAKIKLGYGFPVYYSEPSRSVTRAFMQGGGRAMDFDRESSIITLERSFSGSVGIKPRTPQPWAPELQRRIMAGWTLEAHVSMPDGSMIVRGDGTKKRVELAKSRSAANPALSRSEVLAALAQVGISEIQTGPCLIAWKSHRDAVTPTGDGGFYYWAPIAEPGSSNECINSGGATALVRKHANGTVEYVGGGHQCTYRIASFPYDTLPEAGAPAAEVCFEKVAASRVGPGGDLYFGVWSGNQIFRVTPEGRVFHVAGARANYSGGGPAKSVGLGWFLKRIAVAQDQTIYMADPCYVVKITPDGEVVPFYGRHPESPAIPAAMRYYTGSEKPFGCYSQPYHPESSGAEWQPYLIKGLEVAPDGEVFILSITDTGSHRIDSIAADGTMRTRTQSRPPAAAYVLQGGTALSDAALRRPGISMTLSGELILHDDQPSAAATRDYFRLVSGKLLPFARIPISSSTQELGAVMTPNLDLFRILDEAGPTVIVKMSANASEVLDHETGKRYVFNAQTALHEKTIDDLTGVEEQMFAYDTSGRLISVRDRYGLTTTIERNSSGHPTAIVAPSGERTLMAVDLSGLLSALEFPAGGTYRLGYSTDGLLTRFERPDGSSSDLSYDDGGRLVADIDSRGHGWTLGRETLPSGTGYRVRMVRPTGEVKQYLIESLPSGQIRRTVVDFDGLSTSWLISANDEITTYPDGTVETMTLTADPRFGMDAPYASRIERHNPSTNQTQTITRSRAVVLEVPSDPTSDLKSQTETLSVGVESFTTTYDAASKTESTSRARSGRQTFTTRDDVGNIVEFGIAHGASSTRRANQYEYDDRGSLTRFDGPRTDVPDTFNFSYRDGLLISVTNPLGQTVSFPEHDAEGRVARAVFPTGLEERYRRDVAGRVTELTEGDRVTRIAYDASSGTETETTPTGSTWTYAYAGPDYRLSKITMPTGEVAELRYLSAENRIETHLFDSAGVERGTWSTEYDSSSRTLTSRRGDLTSTVEAHPLWEAPASVTSGGRTVRRYYDELGRMTRVQEADGAEHRVSYEADGSQVVTDAVGRVRRVGLGTLGDLASYNDASSGITSYAVNASAQVAQITDALGVVSTFERDALGRATSINVAGGTDDDLEFTYDEEPSGIGRVTTARNAAGSTSLSYNIHGDVVDRTEAIGGVLLPLHYDYDAAGVPTSVVYPSGMAATYALDAAGRVIGIKARLPGASADATIVQEVRHLPFGEVESFRLGDVRQRSRSRTYDIGYRLRRDTIEGIVDWAFEYDEHGDLTQIEDGLSTRVETFAYDANGRIASASDVTGYGSLAYAYNGVGDRVTASVGVVSEVYAYDAVTGRLTSVQPTGDVARGFLFDAAGRVTSDGNLDFAYTPGGNLASVASVSGGVTIAQYGYNTRNERVSKQLGAETSLYVYADGMSLLGEYNASGSPRREILWLGALPVATVEYGVGEPEILWIHADHLAAPRFITDKDGRVVWSWASDPFGASAANEDADADGTPLRFPLRFAGQYWDRETGLYYNGERYYSPQLGRYLQSDPIGIQGGWNAYAYADSRPTTTVDPRGLEGEPSRDIYRIGRHEPLTDPNNAYAKRGNNYWSPENYPNRKLPWPENFTKPIDQAKTILLCGEGFCFNRFEKEVAACREKPDWVNPKGPSVTTNEVLEAIQRGKDVYVEHPDGSREPLHEARQRAQAEAKAQARTAEAPRPPLPRPGGPMGEVPNSVRGLPDTSVGGSRAPSTVIPVLGGGGGGKPIAVGNKPTLLQ